MALSQSEWLAVFQEGQTYALALQNHGYKVVKKDCNLVWLIYEVGQADYQYVLCWVQAPMCCWDILSASNQKSGFSRIKAIFASIKAIQSQQQQAEAQALREKKPWVLVHFHQLRQMGIRPITVSRFTNRSEAEHFQRFLARMTNLTYQIMWDGDYSPKQPEEVQAS